MNAPHPHRSSHVVVSYRGTEHVLVHGDVLGRLWSANLHINDGRVSECHAMVSMRGAAFHMLGLRGKLRVDGNVVRQTDLAPGMHIDLAPGVGLDILDVVPPDRVLLLQAVGSAPTLVGGVVSLTGRPDQPMSSGWASQAPCHVWPTGDGWMRTQDGEPIEITDNDAWTVGALAYRAWFRQHGADATEREPSAQRLHIRAQFDSVRLQCVDQSRSILLSGLPARAISELVSLGQPVGWETLARDLWGDHPSLVLRKRWDMMNSRLRRKLRAAGIREDLVANDGTGLVQLLLYPGDEIVDAQ